MKRNLLYLLAFAKPLVLLVFFMLSGCKTQQELIINNSEKQTHEAVTPVIQTADWAESWWMKRHNSIIEKNKTKETDLIFIGNSIIHHWEDTGSESWNRYFSKYNPVNMGFGGDRTQHVLWRLENGELNNINPGLAVIMIGTNNASSGHTPQMIADGVIQIAAMVRNKLPKTKIMLLAIFPRGDKDAEIRAINAETSRIFSQLADDKNIFYYNINEIFLDDDENIPKDIMPDKLHPSAKGYDLWGRAIIKDIEGFLDE